MISRRSFARSSAALVLSSGLIPRWSLAARASASAIPVGLQLYTVNAEIRKDFEGTLRKVAAIGYKSVELAGLYGRSAPEFKKALDAVGLSCESAHISLESEDRKLDLVNDLAGCIEMAKVFGMKYIVCPTGRVPGAAKPGVELREEAANMTLNDYRRLGEIFNRIGERTRKAGIQFAYHNHNFEFRQFNGTTGYDELLRVTDPQLVAMEMDCGWVKAAGHDPVAYLTKYPGRFPLLHVKDLKAAAPNLSLDMNSVEIGQGVVDWRNLLKVAKATGLKACYVEQEPPFVRPALESAKMSYEYLTKLEEIQQ